MTAEYRTPDFKGDPSQYRIRRMDCMDCHSRPAHKVHSPNDAVDLALATGRIDPAIPFAKAKVVAALVQPYQPNQKPFRKLPPLCEAVIPTALKPTRLITAGAGDLPRELFPGSETRLVYASRFRRQKNERAAPLPRWQTRNIRWQDVDQSERLQVVPSHSRTGQAVNNSSR